MLLVHICCIITSYKLSMDKIVSFIGHRHEWHCLNVEHKFFLTLQELIKEGYDTFYVCSQGYFDKLSGLFLSTLKKTNSHIKIFKILSSYSWNTSKNKLPDFYSGSILPSLENYFYKQKITKRNEWIVDSSEVIVCHVVNMWLTCG